MILKDLYVKLKPGTKVQLKPYTQLPIEWVTSMTKCAGEIVTIRHIYNDYDPYLFLTDEYDWIFSYKDIAKIVEDDNKPIRSGRHPWGSTDLYKSYKLAADNTMTMLKAYMDAGFTKEEVFRLMEIEQSSAFQSKI